MAKKLDPVVAAYLKEKKGISYDKWVQDAVWNAFREALTDKKSDMYKQIVAIADQKLRDEAYQQARIGTISFD
ncbi:hypothetical protein PT287_09690 [Lactobacillus sp. ESL0679]|uniref:hypothetical protein n=1 Tax=Lactobacillus sp. ESL0679 TaxID=2983209 RepID=UPI0023F9A69D|nr:hypothetical protein [Lactobacillus sp. ESL0679]MDF7683769.1 hypothetical protein [Lactobacillus sp. ESL0679]